MAKASEKTPTLCVRGEGGAVWEVDDTDAIRGLIDAGHVTLVRARQTRTGSDSAEQDSLTSRQG